MISCCISFRNDYNEIKSVVSNLLITSQPNDIEVIIYNDGSFSGDGKPRKLLPEEVTTVEQSNIKIINNNKSFGVGYAFDRAVSHAKGDTIVLMGADVYPRKGWYEKVTDAVTNNREMLGSSVCVGMNPARDGIDDPKNFKRYGADLLFTVDVSNLPKDSPFRKRENYTDLFKAKWKHSKESDEPYEIPCVLGAFYFCTKEYYTKMGGWDTKPNNPYMGHRGWGHLEPHISLKSWLTGNGCWLYPDIEAGHLFGRVDKKNRMSKGVRYSPWMFWNSIWILETMIFSESLRKKLYKHMQPELNWNIGLKWIKQHYGNIEAVKEENRLKFKRDHTIFEEKFGYRF